VSGNVAALPRLRIRRKNFKPPSGWVVYYFCLTLNALGFIAHSVIAMAIYRSPIDGLLGAFWSLLYLLYRYQLRYYRRREEQDGAIISSPPLAFWWVLGFVILAQVVTWMTLFS